VAVSWNQATATDFYWASNVSDRREFISTLTFSLAGMTLPQIKPTAAAQPQVDAETTFFYGNPDARTSLVRFVVRGLDAPAGRMRVFADGRRLVGTAGVLRSGDSLLGELWIPLARQTTVTSVLEAPGLREPLWTTHRLRPRTRWTIVWITPVDPEYVQSKLMALPPLNRAIQTAVWREAGVLGNPLPHPSRLHVMDHSRFLRMGIEAHQLEQAFAIPASGVAYTDGTAALPPTTILALAGAGIKYVLRSDEGGAPLERWDAPDGSHVLAAQITPGGDPRALGFADSSGTMLARVEHWLNDLETGLGALPTGHVRGSDPALAFLAGGHPDDSVAAMVAAVHEWNRRFGYPRILIGAPNEVEHQFQEAALGSPVVGHQSWPSRLEIPSVAALAEIARDRSEERAANGRTIFSPLARAVATDVQPEMALGVIAGNIGTAVPGFVVFNPAPFRRTDAVELPDRRTRIVTDVPAMGYAFMVDDPIAPSQSSASPVADNTDFRLEIDRKTGAIASLVTRADGREWVQGGGLNSVSGAILEELSREVLPGVGVRLTAQRWSSDLQQFSSTVTAYDALPWVDIENRLHTQPREALQCRFEFVAPDPLVRWEIPAGHRESTLPVERVAHLRWLAMRSGLDTLLFRGLDAPYVSVRTGGTIVSFAPSGRTRFRIRAASFPADVVDCARFGWSAEPFIAVPVGGNPGGRLPRFGKLLVLDQPEAAIVGLKQADDGNGLVVYVQNLLGQSSFLSLGPGLLTFDGARKVDLLERDLESQVSSVPDGVAFQSGPWGVTALRLLNVQLSGD